MFKKIKIAKNITKNKKSYTFATSQTEDNQIKIINYYE